MSIDEAQARRGGIDAVGPLQAFDLLELAGSDEGWPPGYVAYGFGADAASFRRALEHWRFGRLGRIADVGCGFGRWSPFLAEVNDEVIGFERHERGVVLGRKLADAFGLDNLRFETADIAAIPTPADFFDGVWCCNVLQFTHRGRVLRELNRVMRVGGRLAILKYNGGGGVWETFFRSFAQGGLDGYNTQFALNCLKNGPLHNGRANYGTAEAVPAMLEEYGFALEGSVSAAYRSPGADRHDAGDWPALARRLETDDAFRDDFLKRPEFANGFPLVIDLVAIKQRDLMRV
jgi:SAM-dependent methyltransferase